MGKPGAGKRSTVDEKIVSSLHQYIELVNRETNSDAMPPSLFRGQRQDRPLLPKLARLYNEKRLKGRFLDVEEAMVREFARQAGVYVAQEQTPWDWLAIAQHHGMATRLLDWTENPLLALWFAVQREAEKQQPGVVWIFNPTNDDYVDPASSASPFALGRTRVLQPRHSNMRLRVQSGRFTVHHFREQDGRFIPLEKHRRYGGQLKKVLIDGSSFMQIRCDLDRCGVNAGTMFPDLGGLAQHVEWQFSLLDDER
ncbi:FRG domain-containing protein [Paraburkholderia guartelaensis]|uniref:FRG domain-containing protein n=1 Tax=Paraburkholderia guartelaensis TaxID=2546446 RepID=UPI002AB5E247|nr:FRG domain-containing protein [Paraburkholderia guartelaensis]